MYSFRRPTAAEVQAATADLASSPFTYPDVGATAGTLPAGWTRGHTRYQLGAGEQAFQEACRALERWEMFRQGWIEVLPEGAAQKPGCVVIVAARLCGVWLLNPARVVYSVDETSPVVRRGFAYGTLPGHLAAGEERFLVEWDPRDDSVWYDVLAFSRPNSLLFRAGYPLARTLQKRFGPASAAAMKRAVS